MCYGDTYSLVGRGTGRNGALRAAVTGVRRVNDSDLLWRRSVTSSSLRDRVGRSEDREKKGSNFGVHICYCSDKDCWW
jgi:hypothetical protein